MRYEEPLDILQAQTPPAWAAHAALHWQSLLADHANCEKKAASTALALMFAYPDDLALCSAMARLAREELRHFEQVQKLMVQLGVPVRREPPGRYAGALRGPASYRRIGRTIDLADVAASDVPTLQMQLSYSTLQTFHGVIVEAAPAGTGGRVKASPLARRMASERGVDLASITGSGPAGRIVQRDVEAAEAGAEPRPAAAAAPAGPPGRVVTFSGEPFRDEPLSQIRKTIAKRLVQSIGPIPTFYLTTEVDMERAAEAREALKAALGEGGKVSFNDIILKATASALAQHPECNAWWQDDHVRQWHAVHLGMAVAIPDGLITPVIRNADQKSMRQINAEARELADKPDNVRRIVLSVAIDSHDHAAARCRNARAHGPALASILAMSDDAQSRISGFQFLKACPRIVDRGVVDEDHFIRAAGKRIGNFLHQPSLAPQPVDLVG